MCERTLRGLLVLVSTLQTYSTIFLTSTRVKEYIILRHFLGKQWEIILEYLATVLNFIAKTNAN